MILITTREEAYNVIDEVFFFHFFFIFFFKFGTTGSSEDFELDFSQLASRRDRKVMEGYFVYIHVYIQILEEAIIN